VTELPDVFLAYQKRLMTSVAAYSVVVAEKSRRIGYSWAAAAIAGLTASATREAGGMDVLYLGYNLEMAREFIDYVAEWARAIEPAAAEVEEVVFEDDRAEKSIQAFRIRFASGFKVLALPSSPRSLRGMQGLVIIDEAAFHEDLEGVLKAAFALLIWGGKVMVISTHDGDENKFNQLVQDIHAGRRPYHLLRVTLDDALEDGLYQRICLVRGLSWSKEAETAWRQELIDFYGSGADEELFCIPSASSGSFLPGALIEARMQPDIPVFRWKAPAAFDQEPEHLRVAEAREWCEENLKPVLAAIDPEMPVTFGFDVGRRGDLSAGWFFGVQSDLVRRTLFTFELRNMPFAQQRQVLWYVLDRIPCLRGGKMDATGLGMQLAEETVQKFGSRVEAVMLNDAWYRENMPPWKAAFEDATIVLPRDRDVLTDHRAVQLVRGIAKVVERSGDKGEKRHGDTAIANALAYSASRGEVMVYEYEAAVRRQAPSAWRDRPDPDEDEPRANSGWLPDLSGAAFR
jgi:phage FluMu gp28-like protein